MVRRRSLLTLLPGCWLGDMAHARQPSAAGVPGLRAELAAIERETGGRLGVCIHDTATGAEVGHRADERFPMCSTFKLLAAALALWQVDHGQTTLARRIDFGKRDLVGWSPVTRERLGTGGITLGELCEATLTTSDNTAANLILAQQGGPAGLTAFVRQLGDQVTRLDRNEPTLNHWQRGELRDTTSPRAMLHTVRRLVLGTALQPTSREQLQRWLVANTTGDNRLRAGLPQAWRVADKTGTGDHITNDVAVVWPPGHAPLLVTAYLSEARASDEACDVALARAGRLLTQIVPPGPRHGDQAG